jgi:hypothetical protein
MGSVERVDLFLVTGGGHTLASNNLVQLLREFSPEVNVLVPHRAMSAGTLVALGANTVVMGPLGRLGPVDPTVSNDFNPRKSDSTKATTTDEDRIGISVEDVSGYLALARDRAGLGDEGVSQAFQRLADEVHPLALGNVHRQSLLIRSLSRRLLALHMDPELEAERIERVVDVLTEKLYFHGYEISRREAEEFVGLPVERPTADVEALMWDLYLAYRRALHLDSLALNGPFSLDSAVIESATMCHVWTFQGIATRKGDTLDIQVSSQGWRRV